MLLSLRQSWFKHGNTLLTAVLPHLIDLSLTGVLVAVINQTQTPVSYSDNNADREKRQRH